MTERASNSPCGVLRVPRACPRADASLQTLHNLRSDTAVNVFSFGGVLHRILPSKPIFFFAKTRDGSEAFSGADMSRARLAVFIGDP